MNLADCLSKLIGSIRFKQYLSLEQRIMMGEPAREIAEILELKFARGQDKEKLFRLMCLLSLTQNGIKPKILDGLKREIIQAFGIIESMRLLNLEKTGIFKKKEGKGTFLNAKSAFKLINEEIDVINPNDIAYTFNGYAPLRLVKPILM